MCCMKKRPMLPRAPMTSTFLNFTDAPVEYEDLRDRGQARLRDPVALEPRLDLGAGD